MKYLYNAIIPLLLILNFTACSKGKSEPPETDLVLNLGQTSSTGITQTMGSNYTFNVVVQSNMPSRGVTIKVDYVLDAGGAPVFSKSLTSTTPTTSVTITEIPFNEIGTVTVTVSSVSNSSNTSTSTFKLVRK